MEYSYSKVSEFGKFSDEEIFEETFKRLKKLHRDENGSEIKYGHFRLTIHQGQFQSIESFPRVRLFFNNERKIQQEEKTFKFKGNYYDK